MSTSTITAIFHKFSIAVYCTAGSLRSKREIEAAPAPALFMQMDEMQSPLIAAGRDEFIERGFRLYQNHARRPRNGHRPRNRCGTRNFCAKRLKLK